MFSDFPFSLSFPISYHQNVIKIIHNYLLKVFGLKYDQFDVFEKISHRLLPSPSLTQRPPPLSLFSSVFRRASDGSDLQTAVWAFLSVGNLRPRATTHSDRRRAFFSDDPFTRHRVLTHESHWHRGPDFERIRRGLRNIVSLGFDEFRQRPTLDWPQVSLPSSDVSEHQPVGFGVFSVRLGKQRCFVFLFELDLSV